jgi:hypothetical protein
MSDKDLLNKNDLNEAVAWLNANKAQVPEKIADLLRRVLLVYGEFAKGKARAKQTLMMLRQAMGILPKSEKGTSELAPIQLSIEQQQELAELKKKDSALALERVGYQKAIRGLLPKPKDFKQLELVPAEELIFATPASARANIIDQQPVERELEFNSKRGLHSTFEDVKRVDLNILVTATTHQVETVTDFSTGKSVVNRRSSPHFQI